MIKSISVSEARERFAEITTEVAHSGVKYEIMKHGKVCAVISSPKDLNDKAVDVNFQQDLDEFTLLYNDALKELSSR